MSEDWRTAAACRDAELFFPIGVRGQQTQTQVAEAKAVCAGCPVRVECLAWAFQTGDDYAVLGGTTAAERRKMRWAAGPEEAATALAASS